MLTLRRKQSHSLFPSLPRPWGHEGITYSRLFHGDAAIMVVADSSWENGAAIQQKAS